MIKVDERKYECKVPGCYYKGYKPLMRLHLYMAHGIDIREEEK